MKAEPETLRRVLETLEAWGLLLHADSALPSVTSLVAGGPVRGSWWSHPRAHAIFHVLEAMGDRTDVLATRLVSGKVTYVHWRLWPALLAVAGSGEPWQTKGLTAEARVLLARVRKGRLRTDRLPKGPGGSSKSVAEAARELERRLLVHAEEVHTESGAHAKWLETWEEWPRRAGVRRGDISVSRAKEELEVALRALDPSGKARLPWRP